MDVVDVASRGIARLTGASLAHEAHAASMPYCSATCVTYLQQQWQSWAALLLLLIALLELSQDGCEGPDIW